MTGFRHAQNLLAYSGGTVRDSHPVFYSPAGLLPHPQALKRNIYFLIGYHCFLNLSIEMSHTSYIQFFLLGSIDFHYIMMYSMDTSEYSV